MNNSISCDLPKKVENPDVLENSEKNEKSENSEKSGISVGNFVQLLWEVKCKNGETQYKTDFTQKNLLHYGHFKGWLEDLDENHPENLLDKRTAARIIHLFMKIELNVQDVPEIKQAEKLSDLYVCRVCVNHVAQVFIRGIISAEKLPDGSEKIFFNHCALVTKKTALEMIQKIKNLYSINQK